MKSGLGAFSIDSLLGGSKNKPSSHQPRSNTKSCCGCPSDRHARTYQTERCRCNCHGNDQRNTMGMQTTSFGQKERKRTTFTEIQTKGMRRIFEQKRYLDGGERETIAKQFNITPAQVKRKWQNFRAKETKNDTHVFKPMFGNTLQSNNTYSRSLSYSAAGQPGNVRGGNVRPGLGSFTNPSNTFHGNRFYAQNLRMAHNMSGLAGLGSKDLGFPNFADYKTPNKTPFNPTFHINSWLS